MKFKLYIYLLLGLFNIFYYYQSINLEAYRCLPVTEIANRTIIIITIMRKTLQYTHAPRLYLIAGKHLET